MKRIIGGCLAICGMAVSIPALAADNLDCMSTGYSADQVAMTDAFVAEFDISDMDNGDIPDEVMAVIEARTDQCADMYDWSEEASEAAGMYRFAEVTVAAIEQKNPRAAQLMEQVETQLSAEESSRFWQIMDSITTDGGAEPTEADYFFIGMVMLRFQPDASEELQSSFGAIAGMKVLMRSTEASFSGL